MVEDHGATALLGTMLPNEIHEVTALDSNVVRVSEPGISGAGVHACAVVRDALQENSIEREHTVSRRHRRSVHSNREHELLLFPHARHGIATSFSITPLDTEKARFVHFWKNP